ncbi:MAG: hypothetical protein NTY08_01210 [Proteobacteria bacterium]|nr:hypothetical protein [Pseudomonadota bacterium]
MSQEVARRARRIDELFGFSPGQAINRAATLPLANRDKPLLDP